MRKLTLVCLSLALVLATGVVFAAGNNQLLDYHRADASNAKVYYSAPVGSAKADTVYLWGGPNRNDGKFQDNVVMLLDTDRILTSHEMSLIDAVSEES